MLSNAGFRLCLAPIVQEICAVKVGDVVDLKIPRNKKAVYPSSGGHISGLGGATVSKFCTLIDESSGFPMLVSDCV